MTVLRLGTRKSALAQVQARWIADQLRTRDSSLQIELVLITTTGDERKEELPANQSLSETKGGLKALFTKEIEEALLDKRIDLAVHSLKDMTVELPDGLELVAVPVREDPRDVWISKTKVAFGNLPRGAKIATSAVRRQAQLRHFRPDVELVPMRGNVDTRLLKLAKGEFDGMVLALAGLRRLGRENVITEILSQEVMLPAIGQGALALEMRTTDISLQKIIKTIDHADSHQAVRAERAFLKRLGGSCQTPIAGYAKVSNGQLVLNGLVVAPEGNPYLHGNETGPASQAEALGQRLAEKLLASGGGKILS